MKRRLLAMLLALVMCLGLTVPAFAACDYVNGKCTYELSNEIIGTVELDYHGIGTVTVYVVPDNTTVSPKNAPGARMVLSDYLFDGWVAGGGVYEAGVPLVVEPILVQEGEEIEGGWLAYAVWTEDTSAEDYDPSPDAMPVSYLDWDEEKIGEGAFRVISESAVKGLGLTIQPYTPGTAPAVPTTATALPTNDKLSVDGKDATPAAYKIDNANYFKLRDVAMLVNGTKAQFSIDYDGEKKAIMITTGQPYQPLGGELGTVPTAVATAITSNDAVYINGVKTDLTAYKIDNANYYGIRALAKALGFNVDWTSERGMFIETDKPYSGT